MTLITAQKILDENKFTSADISLAKVEEFIDNAIDYVNLQTGLSISNMSGSSGSKTVSVTNTQAPVIKALAGLYVNAYLEGDPAVDLSLTETKQPLTQQIELFRQIVEAGMERLRGRSFKRA